MKNNKNLTTVLFATLPMYACISTGKQTDTSLSEDTSCAEAEIVIIPEESGDDSAEEAEDTSTETSGSR
tara:strand:+ start:225 stop:431 length:207 start_codon:yes stop_codon:yes gene_type:complete